MLRFLLILCTFSLLSAAEIWQIGKKDASSQEFKLRYMPWEYARVKYLPKHPDFDVKSNTFTYRIPGKGTITAPAMISGISSESMKNWMFSDEVVTALKLEWEEKVSGNRKIVFHTTVFRNMGSGKDAVELVMPDQTRKLFSIPPAQREIKKDLALAGEFKAVPGKQTLLLRVISNDRHFRLNFDCITLENVSAVQPPYPNAEVAFSNNDFVYAPGEKGELRFKVWNVSAPAAITGEIRDFSGKICYRGKLEITSAQARFPLYTAQRGWYEVHYTLPGGNQGKTSYVVLEPVSKEYKANSRFGCHAVKGFPYLQSYWPEEQQRKLHRAWRAGAKWVRLHGIKWADLQPLKDTPPVWDMLDRRLTLLDEYKMGTLLQVGSTPKWASPSKSERLVPPIGVKEYQMHPPENEAWKRFITDLVSHCKGRVRHYEIWNEPNYWSCFWLSGSPKDYALLIRSAYQEAKKVDPECKIVAGGLVDAIGFLGEVLKENQGKAWFDIMAFHYVIRSLSYDRWRQVLRNFPDMPFFNTEESWWKSNNRQEFAEKIIKGHVIEAANKVDKTFAFGFFDDRAYSPLYGSVNGDGSPLPAYAAYRTMTHRLEDARYIAPLTDSKSTLKLYLFVRNDTPVIVGWSDRKLPEETELSPGGKSVTVVDFMDREKSFPLQNGKLKLQFTSAPQFIEGGDAQWLIRQTEIVRQLPGEIVCRPGAGFTHQHRLQFPAGTKFALQLPAAWQGSFDGTLLKLQLPKAAAPGNYTIPLAITENGKQTVFALKVKAAVGSGLENLLKNGDFKQGGKDVPAYWFKGKKGLLTKLPGGGTNGSNAWKAENTGNGGLHWGSTTKVKVSPGEAYLLCTTAKGKQGTFGFICTVTDAKGKTLLPVRPGINMLFSRTSENWETYSDTINISHPDAAYMSIALLVNHAAPGSVTFDHISLYALSERYPASKHLWQGVAKRASGTITADGITDEWENVPAMNTADRENVVLAEKGSKWSGSDDLSASLRIMRDREYLYLLAEVKDSVSGKRFPFAKAWQGDSIQLAFDPLMSGQDYSDIVLAETPGGKPVIWRYHKCWTPELLTGITATGEIKSAKLAIRHTPGGRIYEAAIPLRELHPLTAESKECGFSFLINDNDGENRKYIEWSSGIGKKRDPKQYGLLRFE